MDHTASFGGFVLTDNIPKSQETGATLVIEKTWNLEEHGKWLAALTVGIVGILFAPSRIGGGRSTGRCDGNHDGLSKKVGTDEDHKNIVKECHDQNGRGNLETVEFDDGEKGNAHGGSKDILHDPKKGDLLGMSHGKAENQPNSSQGETDAVRYDIEDGDIPKIFRPSPPNNFVSIIITYFFKCQLMCLRNL